MIFFYQFDEFNILNVYLFVSICRRLFKDWSQFLFGSWRNNLNQVVHTV